MDQKETVAFIDRAIANLEQLRDLKVESLIVTAAYSMPNETFCDVMGGHFGHPEHVISLLLTSIYQLSTEQQEILYETLGKELYYEGDDEDEDYDEDNEDDEYPDDNEDNYIFNITREEAEKLMKGEKS